MQSKPKIHYINIDLDLIAPSDLAPITANLEAMGVFPLHVARLEDNRFSARFETEKQFRQPSPNIDALLNAIEALDATSKRLWETCTTREFNIGYECGDAPKWLTHEIDSDLLGRMQRMGINLAITLYPADRETTPFELPTEIIPKNY